MWIAISNLDGATLAKSTDKLKGYSYVYSAASLYGVSFKVMWMEGTG